MNDDQKRILSEQLNKAKRVLLDALRHAEETQASSRIINKIDSLCGAVESLENKVTK